MNAISTPDVTCVCLTRARRDWLPQAIACFQKQMYENRKLLIVADESDDIAGLVPQDHRIESLILNSHLTIGEKRNVGAIAATTELICHWDDDDYSAPGRIAHQVACLQKRGKAVMGYYAAKFTDGERWWKYQHADPEKFALGTSLLYRRDWWESHSFLAQPKRRIDAEDGPFVMTAHAAGQLASADGAGALLPRCCPGDLMIARMHPGNTSPKIPANNWVPL